jgi:hypothetical protein
VLAGELTFDIAFEVNERRPASPQIENQQINKSTDKQIRLKQ